MAIGKNAWIEFYQMSVPYTYDGQNYGSKLIPACGSDAICRSVDGRWTIENAREYAKEECKRRGYLAYRIHVGKMNSDGQGKALTDIIVV